jgi:hypothetical protein
MIEKAGRSGKIKQAAALAVTAWRIPHARCDTSPLAGREKARVRAAWTDEQANSLRALGAVAFVRGLIAVDVYPRVNIAAREVDADEISSGRRIAAAIFIKGVVDKI